MANPSPRPEGLSPEQIRAEIRDKLFVVFNGCNNSPLERGIVRNQCEDFLVELFERALAEARHAPTPTCATCAHCTTFTKGLAGLMLCAKLAKYPGSGFAVDHLQPFTCQFHEPKPSEVTP